MAVGKHVNMNATRVGGEQWECIWKRTSCACGKHPNPALGEQVEDLEPCSLERRNSGGNGEQHWTRLEAKGKDDCPKIFKDVFIDLKGKLREREKKRALIHWFTPQVPPTAGGNGMKWWVYCNTMQRRSKHIHMRDLQEAHLKIHHLKTVHRSQKLLHANKLSSGPFSNNVVEYPHISH